MNNMKEFERDLKVAYLNYENNDLKETLKYLDRMLETILKEDKSLENDPFWKMTTCYVFKAIVINNFYNKTELTLNDLDALLGNVEELKKNIKEFCDNFRNNELIDFVSHIENIPENPLKSVIEILMSNIGKMNILNITVETNENAQNSKVQKIGCFCGSSFEFDWSKISNSEKTVYLKCPNCGSELKRGNPYYHDNNKGLTDEESNEIISHIKNSRGIPETQNNQNFELENSVKNVFDVWNEIKNKKQELIDFFESTEQAAIDELLHAKDIATINGKLLSDYLINNNIDCKDKTTQLIISYFGLKSLYDMNFTNDGNIPCEEMSVDNVGLFRAVLFINIVSRLDSVVSIGLPLNIKFTFERIEFAEILSPVLKSYLPKIFNNINEIKIYYKKN